MFDPKRCLECKYCMKSDNTPICGYILIEKHMRGCYTGKKCKKFVKRTTKRKMGISLEEGFISYEYEEEHY